MNLQSTCWITLLSVGLTAVASQFVASQAFAKGNAEIYNIDTQEVPAVIYNDDGAIFLDDALGIYKTYSWKQTKPDEFSRAFYVADLDGDKKPEFIGAGKPTFVLNNTGDPVWFDDKGCDEVLIADFAANDSLDIACIRKTAIRLLTFDNQLIWEIDLTRKIGNCRAGDVNGDHKADIECKLGSGIARLDGSSGNVIALDSKEQQITQPYQAAYNPVRPISQDAPPAKLTAVSFKGKPMGLLEKDLNHDGFIEFTVVSDKEIAIKDGNPESKKPNISFSNRAKSYKRTPVATISDTYTNNFQDDADAKKRLIELQDKLAKCYSSAVKKSPFAGAGRLILQSTVNDSSKVEEIQEIYSSLADKKISQCAKNVISKADFGPVKPETKAAVNLTILYSFKSK